MALTGAVFGEKRLVVSDNFVAWGEDAHTGRKRQ